ncbi:hypothetical protein [Algoriphagus sp.]|uniref:hypothetical protein n=1 Tax=Algoriphagus sp. TaxID=1872435 RepID=UPI0025F58B22|nr:hypothetical protein [Algoriphagus sp.]
MKIEEIKSKLSNLTLDSKRNFGIMPVQHMVEHLTITVKISSNRISYPKFEPTEKQLAQKEALLNTNLEFPKGVKAPGIGDNLMPLKHPNLSVAKENLIKSLEEYQDYFKENQNAKTIHPRFGPMTFLEWELFHPKHFQHHFEQFNIW